jgi:hypothetical protein
MTEQTFAKTVWDELSRLDVSDHIDVIESTGKRPEISYLSWSKAWTLLKAKFPGSTYAHRPDLWHPDDTVEVEVDVVISDGSSNTMFTNARLGVMDFYFGPIKNPSARDINDARQRALVKALAFAGLGLNLWQDSSIPVGRIEDLVSPEQVTEISDLIEKAEPDLDRFFAWLGCDNVETIPYRKFNQCVAELKRKIARKEADK